VANLQGGVLVDWTAAIDAYCERVSPDYWAEPVNAVTNLAFVLAAVVMARRLGRAGLPLAWVLTGLLAAIGVGSFLFHTFAQPWAAIMDVAPIMGFTLVYIYAANRHFWGLRPWLAALGAAAFLPFAAVVAPLFEPVMGGSSAYAPLPVLIFAYAALLRSRAPETARGLAIGAGILCVSLAARALDEPLCDAFPIGTHFAWHLLNALMLGWMIEVYRRHMLARAADGR